MRAAGPEEAWWSPSCIACSPSGPPFLLGSNTPSAAVTPNSSSSEHLLSCPLPGLLLLLWSVSHDSCFDAGLTSDSCDFRRGWLWIPSFVVTSDPVQIDCYRGRLRIRNKPKCEKRL